MYINKIFLVLFFVAYIVAYYIGKEIACREILKMMDKKDCRY